LAAKVFEEVNYCIRCGHPLTQAERFGGLRPVCEACGWIYFADPKVAVAALIEKNGQVFLVRRVNDPQRGLWTLPAGFVDAGEDPARAVERECREETGLVVRVIELLDVLYGQEHPRGAHILIVYRVEVISGDIEPADDVDKAAFFSRQELPPLAFSTTEKILASFSSLT
jgi:8-oxo-dGTP diphosphatase